MALIHIYMCVCVYSFIYLFIYLFIYIHASWCHALNNSIVYMTRKDVPIWVPCGLSMYNLGTGTLWGSTPPTLRRVLTCDCVCLQFEGFAASTSMAQIITGGWSFGQTPRNAKALYSTFALSPNPTPLSFQLQHPVRWGCTLQRISRKHAPMTLNLPKS